MYNILLKQADYGGKKMSHKEQKPFIPEQHTFPSKEELREGKILNAAINQNWRVLEKYMHYGLSPSAHKDGFSLLHFAVVGNHPDKAVMLLNQGALINMQDKENGCTPLLLAVKKAHAKVIDVLLERGADVNKPTKFGYTPLMIAAELGLMKITQKLLKQGAKVNVSTNDGVKTPLLSALMKKHISVAKLLLDAGADVFAKNEFGVSAVDYVQKEGFDKTVLGTRLKAFVLKAAKEQEQQKDTQNQAILLAKMAQNGGRSE